MKNVVDLSACSYTEWLSILFDCPVLSEEEAKRRADSQDFEISDSAVIIDYISQLCRDFNKSIASYSLWQINHGIWFLLSYPLFFFGEDFFSSPVSIDKKVACIESMYFVYSEFVAKSEVEQMENCFNMWWDIICHDFWGSVWMRQNRLPEFTPEETADIANVLRRVKEHAGKSVEQEYNVDKLDQQEKVLLETMFNTLVRILALPDPRTQGYALHGLGHLHHPRVSEIVQNYIDTCVQDLEPDEKAWLEHCRDGTVM